MKADNIYKKVLWYSSVLGIVGGLGAVLFTVITGKGVSLLFDSAIASRDQGDFYWIPLTAGGALLVTYLRKRFAIPKHVPSAIEMAQQAEINLKTALPLLLIAVISIVSGASLGPSFGIILFGGAFAQWFAQKYLRKASEETRQSLTRIGMTGSLGAVFGAPILSVILTTELSGAVKNYIRFVLPLLIAASLGYVVLYGILGATIINAYELPLYEYRNIDLVYGALLGICAVVALLIFKAVSAFTVRILAPISHLYTKALIGGLIVGLLSYTVPLTFGSGNAQLLQLTLTYSDMAISGMIVLILAKIVAIKVSEESGFIGGTVFPILFYSGAVGVLIHMMFPSIPVALSVGALMASVPGAVLSAPIGLILIAVGSTGQTSAIVPPITIAVVVTQIGMHFLKQYAKHRES